SFCLTVFRVLKDGNAKYESRPYARAAPAGADRGVKSGDKRIHIFRFTGAKCLRRQADSRLNLANCLSFCFARKRPERRNENICKNVAEVQSCL
ncbi:hypothetical protein, partial [Burkholderia multivorans]|uniref:hypothetical protein n=1 Tax=Burkholderia multivorans TaxID=87883 RepID=UPI0019553C53